MAALYSCMGRGLSMFLWSLVFLSLCVRGIEERPSFAQSAGEIQGQQAEPTKQEVVELEEMIVAAERITPVERSGQRGGDG